MPVAVVVPVLATLAFALVAIVAIDLITQFTVQPLRKAAASVSGAPAIGGLLAWALSQAALLIEVTLNASQWIIDQGKNDAFNAWAWLIQNTVQWVFAGPLQGGALALARWPTIQWLMDHWDQLWIQAFNTLPAVANQIASDMAGLHQWIDTVELPMVRGIGNDLAALHAWIDTVELPMVRGIGDDLAGLHAWIDNVLVKGIDQMLNDINARIRQVEADVSVRALESEAEALRARVSTLEAQVAALAALGILAALGVDTLENLRCIAGVECSLLDPLLSGDLEDRVVELELSGS